MNHKSIQVLFLVMGLSMEAKAQCPIPATAVEVTVDVSTSFNKANGIYSYNYRLRNGPGAKVGIYRFNILTPQDASSVSLPSKWRKVFFPQSENPEAAIQVSTFFQPILPGTSQGGIRIDSKLPPGLVRFYSEGQPSEVRKAVTIDEDDEAAPDCPGFFDSETSVFDEMITGFTIGPAPLNQVELSLKTKVKRSKPIKDEDDENETPEISPLETGTIEVLAFSDKDFDLSQVDLTSIRLGPAEAAPLKAELIGQERIKPHWRHRPNKKQILAMEFDIASLKIRCSLDQALFLTAKTKSKDKSVIGVAKMKPALCNQALWKDMRKNLKWMKRDDDHDHRDDKDRGDHDDKDSKKR